MNQIVIIPAYNEAETIEGVLQNVRRAAPEFDVVVVNDGSTDETSSIVRGLGVPQLNLPCNLGYARALQTGLQYAVRCQYKTIVFMDADGQHDASDLHKLTQALRDTGADLAIGSRFITGGDPAHRYRAPLGRRIGMWLFSIATLVFGGKRIYDTTSGFKALRVGAARALLRARFVDFHAEVLVHLASLGYKIVEVPIEVRERTAGSSMYSSLTAFTYPFRTLLFVAIAVLQARLTHSKKEV